MRSCPREDPLGSLTTVQPDNAVEDDLVELDTRLEGGIKQTSGVENPDWLALPDLARGEGSLRKPRSGVSFLQPRQLISALAARPPLSPHPVLIHRMQSNRAILAKLWLSWAGRVRRSDGGDRPD